MEKKRSGAKGGLLKGQASLLSFFGTAGAQPKKATPLSPPNPTPAAIDLMVDDEMGAAGAATTNPAPVMTADASPEAVSSLGAPPLHPETTPSQLPMTEDSVGTTSRRAKKRVSYAAVDLDSDAESAPPKRTRKGPANAQKKPPKKKTSRAVIESSDSEESAEDPDDDCDSESDYQPDAEEAAMVEDEEKQFLQALATEALASSDEGEEGEPEGDAEEDEAHKAAARKPAVAKRKSPASGGNGGAFFSNFSASTPKPVSSKSKKGKDEERYEWLVHPKDKNMRSPGEPGYDPNTLYIPKHYFEKVFTPFEKQYWLVKQDFWDTILFFKKGKFYELYEKDADIGQELFDLRMTDRVNMKMVGVPEATLTDWAQRFLKAGFKVARADERESAIAKQIREKKTSKGPSKGIIERKLAAVYTRGTLTGDFLVNDNSTYILSIKEDPDNLRYGICFADTGTAEFNLCSVEDDAARTQLETLLVQIKPAEILHEQGNLSPETLRLFKVNCANISVLQPGAEFWDAQATVDHLDASGYFTNRKPERGQEPTPGNWPRALVDVKDDNLTISAVGALVFYFNKLMLDMSLLSEGHFHPYDALHHGTSLMLDGQTLQNLEVLENNVDRGPKGTVMHLLCHCTSAFGKRLFRKWVCHPLRAKVDIEDRLNAVDDLTGNTELFEILQALLKDVPDLERLIARVHVGQCKLPDFLRLLDGFDMVWETVSDLQASASSLTSRRLKKLLSINQLFPSLDDELSYFSGAFNRKSAKNEGHIIPNKGAYPEYDETLETIEKLENQLEKLRAAEASKLGCKITFYHPNNSKEPYQLQLPSGARVPDYFVLKSQTKTVKRYWTPAIEDLQQPLAEAKEIRQQFLRNLLRTTQNKFDERSQAFGGAVACLAEVDCLMSLALAKQSMGYPMCRPEFVEPTDGRHVLDVKDLRHPCLVESGAVADYIPNDTALGGEAPGMIILTGPNMGGKSTLLRQTCVAVIMAQLGCYVPAESMRLSPVDRIFTRIGACDNIIAGRSTFMVELKETASILRHATAQSLVILDELGRGTSTHDGYAIAYAVLKHLAETTKCRGLFATHYHNLTEEFSRHEEVTNFHMACCVEPGRRDVVFLYKLQPGVCSKSYGMNVASMAGVPASVIEVAESKAEEFERESCRSRSTRARAFGRLYRMATTPSEFSSAKFNKLLD